MANRTDIPYGKENAVRIDVLATLWSISDRNARDMIATFRKTASDDNTVIVSSSKGPAGYWRTDKPEEIRAYINETEARAHNTTLALREARRVLKNLENDSMSIFDLPLIGDVFLEDIGDIGDAFTDEI